MNSASLPPVRIAQKRDSQRRDNLNKLAHADCSFWQVGILFKHHEIPILVSCMTAPHCAEVDFLPAVIIFQVFALGFRKDDLALFRQNQNIRIVIDIAVDTEALTGNVSVPPAHIRQGGQFHN